MLCVMSCCRVDLCHTVPRLRLARQACVISGRGGVGAGRAAGCLSYVVACGAVRCSGPSGSACAGGMVAVNKAPQSRSAGQNAASCRGQIETQLGRAGMGRVATTN